MINTIDNVLPLTWCLHSCEGTGLGEETQEIQTNQIISGIDEKGCVVYLSETVAVLAGVGEEDLFKEVVLSWELYVEEAVLCDSEGV